MNDLQIWKDQLKQIIDDHYGLNPDHPGEFFDYEAAEWVKIPDFTGCSLFKEGDLP
jgi:hypothetical protein